MAMKGEKGLFFRIFLISIFLFLANLGVFFYDSFKSMDLNAGLTGNAVQEVISSSIQEIDFISRITFIFQWVVLALVLLLALVTDGVVRRKNKFLIKNIKLDPSKKKTDIDKLYDILRQRGFIKISVAAKLFNVKSEVVLEWAKILESGNLAYIDYPMFGGVVIRLDEKQENKKNEEQENKKDEKKGFKINKSDDNEESREANKEQKGEVKEPKIKIKEPKKFKKEKNRIIKKHKIKIKKK